MTRTQLFPESAGTFTVEGLPDVQWATMSTIEAQTPPGGEVYDPDTDRRTQLNGPISYTPITCTTPYSDPQVRQIKAFFENTPIPGRIRDEVTAIFQMGNTTWSLGDVRMIYFATSNMDKLSSDPAYITCRFSFSSTTII
ncbi:MAG: hypothetical protein F6K53_20075 [Moorea sp. SIO4A1]|uniref:hypothetical protein n=1 Tax=Moorena sp. SIO4A1 TaxID=2607835 RepID=UPI00141829F0|nr:hypothetical protein [Moorena sp. SIO4A1]NEO43302.1 hypothetical protein [Moorena sp. SIO4A3]NEQ59569.1 hypothetical protein [Moorena sp. SIO4A1]